MNAIAEVAAARAFLSLALLSSASVFAYPDASPWGAANPAADESCDSCHYDYEPVRDSDAIQLAGLPSAASPGSAYEVSVRMAGRDAVICGFQLVATAGTFAVDGGALEAAETAIRSTRAVENDGVVEWTFSWRAPEQQHENVEMFLAVSAANDDQSPFGDTIHYRRFVVPMANP